MSLLTPLLKYISVDYIASLVSPLDVTTVHRMQVTPNFCRWLESGTVRLKCLAQEPNVMTSTVTLFEFSTTRPRATTSSAMYKENKITRQLVSRFLIINQATDCRLLWVTNVLEALHKITFLDPFKFNLKTSLLHHRPPPRQCGNVVATLCEENSSLLWGRQSRWRQVHVPQVAGKKST